MDQLTYLQNVSPVVPLGRYARIALWCGVWLILWICWLGVMLLTDVLLDIG